MAKLLAALNLPQVGEIKLLPADHPDDGEAEKTRTFLGGGGAEEHATMVILPSKHIAQTGSCQAQAGCF
jgi:hypothetical protein